MAPRILAREVLEAFAGAVLEERQTSGNQIDPSSGTISPHNINNTVFFILFGLIGASFVVVGIWFFFWAKNGGFHFHENDWEDYKSTVLRRKGPNGTLLSGATPSTNLGGGSIYKDVDDNTTVVTESTDLSGITAGASDLDGRERRRAKREQRRREKEKEKREKESARRHRGEDGALVDEGAERAAQDHLRSYRHERPARVGGLNKESEGSAWDGSTNPTESNVSSALLSNRESTPTNSPSKPRGIRKVYSTADRNADREAEHIRAEARLLQDRGRASIAASSSSPRGARASRSTRDFSWQHAQGSTTAESAYTRDEDIRVPGSWASSDVGTDLGTKSYRHPMPELRAARQERRGGYRRSRTDDYQE